MGGPYWAVVQRQAEPGSGEGRKGRRMSGRRGDGRPQSLGTARGRRALEPRAAAEPWNRAHQQADPSRARQQAGCEPMDAVSSMVAETGRAAPPSVRLRLNSRAGARSDRRRSRTSCGAARPVSRVGWGFFGGGRRRFWVGGGGGLWRGGAAAGASHGHSGLTRTGWPLHGHRGASHGHQIASHGQGSALH
jgi:hypothetical protein